eukprot:TRINITY_DN67792_c1_g16_i1.p1 TRINITY_DN67792_c1_g16~~TRINITY_DN67792_c1_g16_i1.p1  ORF type:complete len:427 (-),score=42.55 TRINITY_DN67792_c1_g16_i1:143-1423(-)
MPPGKHDPSLDEISEQWRRQILFGTGTLNRLPHDKHRSPKPLSCEGIPVEDIILMEIVRRQDTGQDYSLPLGNSQEPFYIGPEPPEPDEPPLLTTLLPVQLDDSPIPSPRHSPSPQQPHTHTAQHKPQRTTPLALARSRWRDAVAADAEPVDVEALIAAHLAGKEVGTHQWSTNLRFGGINTAPHLHRQQHLRQGYTKPDLHQTAGVRGWNTNNVIGAVTLKTADQEKLIERLYDKALKRKAVKEKKAADAATEVLKKVELPETKREEVVERLYTKHFTRKLARAKHKEEQEQKLAAKERNIKTRDHIDGTVKRLYDNTRMKVNHEKLSERYLAKPPQKASHKMTPSEVASMAHRLSDESCIRAAQKAKALTEQYMKPTQKNTPRLHAHEVAVLVNRLSAVPITPYSSHTTREARRGYQAKPKQGQ